MGPHKRRRIRRIVSAALTIGSAAFGLCLTDIEAEVFEDGSMRITACVSGAMCDDR